MDQHQSIQESKLTYSIICRPNRLRALLAADADTDMCLQYHTHIIGPIANPNRYKGRNLLSPALGKSDDVRLLLGGNAAADYRVGVQAEAEELVREVFRFQH